MDQETSRTTQQQEIASRSLYLAGKKASEAQQMENRVSEMHESLGVVRNNHTRLERVEATLFETLKLVEKLQKLLPPGDHEHHEHHGHGTRRRRRVPRAASSSSDLAGPPPPPSPPAANNGTGDISFSAQALSPVSLGSTIGAARTGISAASRLFISAADFGMSRPSADELSGSAAPGRMERAEEGMRV